MEFTNKIINNALVELNTQLEIPNNEPHIYRLLGGLETMLITKNVIIAGQPIDYGTVERIGWFGRKYLDKESYQEFIIRKTKEYLHESE